MDIANWMMLMNNFSRQLELATGVQFAAKVASNDSDAKDNVWPLPLTWPAANLGAVGNADVADLDGRGMTVWNKLHATSCWVMR